MPLKNYWRKEQEGKSDTAPLEDKLLILAYRTPRPEEELSEPLAQLMDKIRQFNESQIKIMGHFADFVSEIDGRGSDEC